MARDDRGVVIVEFALLMAFVGILAVPAMFLVLDIIAKGELSNRAPAVAQLLGSDDQQAPQASNCTGNSATDIMWCEAQAIIGAPLGTSGYTLTVACTPETGKGSFCSGAGGVEVTIVANSVWQTPVMPLPRHISETAEYVNPLLTSTAMSFKPFTGTVSGSSSSIKINP
jgi:hypothetical protein